MKTTLPETDQECIDSSWRMFSRLSAGNDLPQGIESAPYMV